MKEGRCRSGVPQEVRPVVPVTTKQPTPLLPGWRFGAAPGPAYDMAAQATPSGRMWVCVRDDVGGGGELHMEWKPARRARRRLPVEIRHRTVQVVPSNFATFSPSSFGKE